MRMSVLGVLTAVAIGAAGCTNPPTTQPSASPSGSPSPGAGVVASCLVGAWQTTSVSGVAGVSGGSGAKLTITANGTTNLDFTGMQPITFAAKIGDTNVKGRFVYAGQANTQIATSSPSATTGSWEPMGAVDWSRVRVTLDLTEPVVSRPVDNLPIRDFLADKASQTGGVVDINPMLSAGTYTCENNSNTLILSSSSASGLKWTLAKTPG